MSLGGIPTYVNARYSNGNGMAGMQYAYLRPNYECMNKSRRVGAFYSKELWEKAEKVVLKWYYPKIILYKIDGLTIASNNEINALKEWWRICEKKFVGIPFPVTLANPQPVKP